MTKSKSVKFLDELNTIVNQQSKKIISQFKLEMTLSQNIKTKELLEKISKDYNISLTELHNKYLSTKEETKLEKTTDETHDESIVVDTNNKIVYSLLVINDKEYFVKDSILFNSKKKQVGKMENNNPVFYK